MSAFDRSDRFQQELPELLTAIAAPRVPDYVDDLMASVAATRQRPRWSFPASWLPFAVTPRRPAFFPPFPLRSIIIAALLLALLAAGLLIVGSQQRVPPPFGLARNGALVYGSGDDIYARDTVDGTSRLLVAGGTDDFAATFTRDGSRLLFLRRAAGSPGSIDERIQLMTADRDGGRPVAITEPLLAPDWWDVSPDGATIVVAAGVAPLRQHLFAADVAHPVGAVRPIDVGDSTMTCSFPNFLGPNGSEIVFRGATRTPSGRRSGIFAVRPDGTGLRPVTPTNGDLSDDYMFPQPAPDGSAIAYSAWEDDVSALRLHVFDLRTGTDRVVSDRTRSEGFATFSPDSQRLVFVSYGPEQDQIMVSRIDGTGRLPMGPMYRQVEDQSISGIFSPDGQSVIVNDPASKETRLVDVATGGDGDLLPWSAGDITGWQRLAP